MTRDEILAMEAGPELNALVAEWVMEWEWDTHNPLQSIMWLPNDGPIGAVKFHDGGDDDGVVQVLGIPDFSGDIAAAWEVVEKMVPIKYGFNLAIESPPGPWGDWGVHFYNGGTHLAWADTAPLSICHAALLAVMERDE